MAANWEVDLITFAEDVESWINLHPKVFFIRRTIKFTNPGRSLDSARSQMRDLGSRRRTEVDAAPRNRILNTDSHTFRELLEGVETGDIDILLKSRGEAVGSEERFKSEDQPSTTLVSRFQSLRDGMDTVLTDSSRGVANASPIESPGLHAKRTPAI